MYRRLPHGPHGMGREAVARHQRARLYGAMIEAIDRQGYNGTTVAHVIALAGVSRRAFYEQFANKEDCFLATYDIAVARAKKRMLEGWMSERGLGQPHAPLLPGVRRGRDQEHEGHAPRADRWPGHRRRQPRTHAALRGRLRTGVWPAASAPRPTASQLPPLAPKAIVGGARYALFTRLRTGREAELPSSPTNCSTGSAPTARPPRGAALSHGAIPPHVPAEPARFLGKRREAHARARRRRASDARPGLQELTDPQIAQFAGMSTESFHKHFPDKRACYLAVSTLSPTKSIDAMIGRLSPRRRLGRRPLLRR